VKIIEAKPLENFRVFLRFDDGVSGIVDLSDLAGRGVFEAWNQPGIFQQVRVTDYGAIEWPGPLDLCPDSLYLQITGKQLEDIWPGLREQATHA
jgi:hypothetical protein